MVMNLTAPGVYIRELDSGVRVISGVATSITAFVGRARRGPIDDPIRIFGFADYTRIFGGLWEESTMSYAVQQFFLNGGAEALIIRAHHPSAANALDLSIVDLASAAGGVLQLTASGPGVWGDALRATVEHAADANLFHLTVREVNPGPPVTVLNEERFLNLSVDPNNSRFITRVLEQSSALARLSATVALPGGRPDAVADAPFTGGNDGGLITFADVGDEANLSADRRGIWALENADLFNILVIPPFQRPLDPNPDVDPATWGNAVAYCHRRRAMLIVDPPADWTFTQASDPAAVSGVLGASPFNANAAMYFPRIRVEDPRKDNRLETFVPSGAIAGIMARTDATRGVWKAPAGQEAAIAGARELSVRLTQEQNGPINQIGVNALRNFRAAGNVVWGARTRLGHDELASQWKYINVRRTALYIEESLFRGTQWVVFEGNDEKLWSQIRLNLGAFMHDLFRKGAFQGLTPRDAYFVKCDAETTTQTDIDRGIVNIIVGFAPLKPAEFVVISIQQIARQEQV